MTKEERKEQFRELCRVELFDQPQNLIWDKGQFFDYWTESGSTQKKLRYEFERTFNIPLRFGTWRRNYEKWNKPKEQTSFFEQAANKFLSHGSNQIS